MGGRAAVPTRLTEQWACIVVGAGSAGAVVAARLSEDQDTTVLLLDAGPDWRAAECPVGLRSGAITYGWDITSPQVVPPDFIWPDQFARRVPGRPPTLYRRGRGLGGSSTINGCYAIRPPMAE